MEKISESQDNFKEKTLKSFLIVSLGTLILLGAKAFSWLIVPKMLGIIEYGYYKTFTLYLVYTAFLHFGFPDGILLLHGGQKYSALKKEAFRRYSKLIIRLEAMVSVTIMIMAFFFDGVERFIFIMLAVDAFFVNVSVYFRFITQAVMRFKDLTKRNILQGVLQIVIIVLLYISSHFFDTNITGQTYIVFIVAIDIISCLWYMVTYRDIIIGRTDSFLKQKDNIKKYFYNGIVLTVAYQIANLVFTLDSQMVSWLFDVKTYSLYAFSYTVVHMVTNTIGAVSTVLFPGLRKMGREEALQQFSFLMSMISVIACGMLFAYFPISYFIAWYLPDYVESINYLKIIMPGLAITCCINMVIFTYYKVLNYLGKYVKVSCIVLVIGFILNAIGYLVVKQPSVFSALSIITLYIWYILAARFITVEYQIHWKKCFVYMCFQSVVFYISVYMHKNIVFSACIYLFVYLFITFLFYRKELISAVCRRATK